MGVRDESVDAAAAERTGAGATIRAFLIADVRGYTRFSQEQGDEAAARLTARFAEVAGEAVEAYEGDVVEVRGDEVLAVFMSPRRAIRAAVELQLALADEVAADPSLPLLAGVGLDAGEAVPVGSGYRGRAVNLAARLCARAAAGEVLATAQVVHLAGAADGLRYEALGAVTVKGVDRPVEIVAVRDAEAAPAARFDRLPAAARPELAAELDPATPLVGRERELRRLGWMWRRARHGRGRACFLAGRSGIGKTRLVAELARSVDAAGWPVVYVRGAGPAETAVDALQLVRSPGNPMLVIVDDLDVCGGTVLDTIDAVAASLAGRPVLLVATYRERAPLVDALVERIDPSRAAVLDLGPLDHADVLEIAALYTGVGGTATPPARVLRAAGGIPAAVHRSVSQWAAEGAARRVERTASTTAAGRSLLQASEAELALNVVDLEWAREQSQVFAAGETRAAVMCPYKGLASFEPEDADFFFGRERLVAELTARTVGATFLAVVGPSGSGKSSAVKAGLLPALAGGVIPGSETWQQLLLRPGEHPMRELERALGAGAADAGDVVLVIDQFEEVFTACSDEGERRVFVEAITADRGVATLVVVAVRADYYGRCASYPALARLMGQTHVLVGPMDADELRRAVELPARRAGLSVEDGLADTLVSDVVGEPGGLPLFSTALLDLWQRRSGRTLTMAGYRETGGVRGAVAGLAEDAYARLSPDQQTLARRILLRLAAIGEGGAVRRRVPLAELDTLAPDAAAVVDALTQARLLTASDGYVEVAHEALLREWPRLRDWLQEDSQGRELYLHLIKAARDWDERGRDRGELYRGARLSATLEWAAHHDADLNQLERDFLAASRALNQRELRRLRLLLAGALVFLLVAAVAAVIALVQRGSAQRAATVAEARQLAAQALVEPRLDRSLLLAREAVNLDDSAATRSSLLATLVKSPAAVRVLDVPGRWAGGTAQLGLSPDGKTLVIGTDGGQLLFFSTPGLQPEGRVLPPGFGDGRGVSALAFSRDGSLLAVGGGSGGTIVLLDGRTHHLVRLLPRVPAAEFIVRLVFSPNGNTLAVAFARPAPQSACGGSLVITRFDVSTGRRLDPVRNVSGAHPCVDGIDKLTYTPSGNRLIASDWADGPRGKVVVLDATDLRVVRTYPMPDVTGVALSPDGKTLAITKDDGTLGFMRFPNGRLQPAQGRHTNGIWSAEFTPDGRSLITTSSDRTAIVWDVATGAEREVLAGHTDIVPAEAVSPDGQTVYTGSADGTVIAWDLSGRRRLGQALPYSPAYPAVVYSNPQATAVAVGPDGQLVALSPSRGVAQLWNLRTLARSGPQLRGFRELDVTATAGGAEDLAFSPDGTLLAAGGGAGSPVVVWNLKSGRITNRLVPPYPPGCGKNDALPFCTHGDGLTFSPDGGTLANGDGDNGALLWNLRTDAHVRLPIPRGRWVLSLAYSPDGTRLVTVDGAGTGVLWDVAHRRRLATFPADNARGLATSVAFSPDGTAFVTGAEGALTLRAATTGRLIGTPLPIPNGYNGALAFSPDGTTVAVDSGDGVELWDIATRTQIGTGLPGAPPQAQNPGGPGNLRFTPDGRHLIIVNPNGLATIWNVTEPAWEAQACQVAGRNLTHAEWQQFLPDRPYQPVCS
jgi:WD40 repeat protein/class 3 adenylate cyclase/energy-coupling factor transporter ATP-binding protein EcfA2